MISYGYKGGVDRLFAIQYREIRPITIVSKRIAFKSGSLLSNYLSSVNAVLAEPSLRNDRIIIIEDTKELRCPAEDKVELLMKNTGPRVTMIELLRMTLRLRPDRIIIGEVRGDEARRGHRLWERRLFAA